MHQMRHRQPPRGFTILESLTMLVILAMFTMVSIAVLRKGLTPPPGDADEEWLKKGGDAAVLTTAPLPDGALPVVEEQPGFGGSFEKSGKSADPDQ